MENFRTTNKKQLAARVLCTLLLGTYLVGGYGEPVAWGASATNASVNVSEDTSSNASSAWGENTTASSKRATAWGYYTEAKGGTGSTAWGSYTVASGIDATAFGSHTEASNSEATAFGYFTKAKGLYATAFGWHTEAAASCYAPTAWGIGTKETPVKATGNASTAFGVQTVAEGDGSTAWGGYYDGTNYYKGGTASGDASTAFGVGTLASSEGSTAWGYYTTAGDGTEESEYTTAWGFRSKATGYDATAWGDSTTASEEEATAWGYGTEASGRRSTAWGHTTKAKGDYATTWGSATTAKGKRATAWGWETTAEGETSTSWGESTLASGKKSTAWGSNTIASGHTSTAWGWKSVAEGKRSTAFGDSSEAHAENSLAALGGTVETAATNSAAIGNGAKVTVADAVALGGGSVASREAGATDAYLKTDSDTGNAWVSTHNAIAVGDDGTVTRQITGVAAGSKDTDAVNVAQLKKVAEGAVYTAGDSITIDNSTKTVSVKKDGIVESGNTGIVTGGTVYTALQNETRVTADGNYIKAANSAADNLTALDTQVKKNEDAIGTTADGNYVKASDSVGTNLGALDTQVKKNEDAIGTTADGNYVKASNSVGENLGALDAEIAALAGGAGAGIDELSHRISNVDSKVEKVGAGAAALAALHPMDTDGKFSMAAGFGNYRSANAMALGLFYRPNDQVLFSMGGSMGNGENLLNVGVSFALDKGVSTSKAAMARKIVSLTEENAQQAAKIETLEARLAALEAKLGK